MKKATEIVATKTISQREFSGGFDNSVYPLMPWPSIRHRRSFHQLIQIEYKKILYCRIRKNASSSFRRLTAQNHWQSLEDSAHLSGNNVYVSADISDKMISSANHAVFVYRSTFSRILALFKNKFIQGAGAADIQRNFYSVTGIYPNDVSFFDFVNIYLTKRFQDLDPHTFPQRCHLLPIQYSDAIPIEFLQNRMSVILGNKPASRYFSSPTNSTGNETIQTAECLVHVPVSVIKQRHCVNGLLPGNDAFRDPTIKILLREIYHEDEVLFHDPQSK